MNKMLVCMVATSIAGFTACTQSTPVPAPSAARAAESQFRPVASIQEIMLVQVDPAADFLWDSVGTISRAEGVEEKQPRTDAEWQAVRHHALSLIEATNLLVVEGRHVAREGQAIADAGSPGILSAKAIQKAIDEDRPTFIRFAQGLADAGAKALAAIDAKNAAALLEAGDAIDTACEECHKKYWYPDAPQPPK